MNPSQLVLSTVESHELGVSLGIRVRVGTKDGLSALGVTVGVALGVTVGKVLSLGAKLSLGKVLGVIDGLSDG